MNDHAVGVIADAERLGEAAASEELALRLLGGVAVAIRCPSARVPPLQREYGDIDAIARGRDRRKLGKLLKSQGYEPVEQLNAVHGHKRLFFYDDERSRRLDVFLDHFDMCHDLDLRERIKVPGLTLPLADLLLTKLQVVETTEKDLRDITALLRDHALGDSDESINVAYLKKVTGADWGLWQTVTMVSRRAEQFATELGQVEPAAERARELVGALEQAPKSTGWKMRARIGERVRWYKLPEEPDFG
jgi:hypothetical protein